MYIWFISEYLVAGYICKWDVGTYFLQTDSFEYQQWTVIV